MVKVNCSVVLSLSYCVIIYPSECLFTGVALASGVGGCWCCHHPSFDLGRKMWGNVPVLSEGIVQCITVMQMVYCKWI